MTIDTMSARETVGGRSTEPGQTPRVTYGDCHQRFQGLEVAALENEEHDIVAQHGQIAQACSYRCGSSTRTVMLSSGAANGMGSAALAHIAEVEVFNGNHCELVPTRGEV